MIIANTPATCFQACRRSGRYFNFYYFNNEPFFGTGQKNTYGRKDKKEVQLRKIYSTATWKAPLDLRKSQIFQIIISSVFHFRRLQYVVIPSQNDHDFSMESRIPHQLEGYVALKIDIIYK